MKKSILLDLKSRNNGQELFALWDFLKHRGIDIKIKRDSFNLDLVPKIYHEIAFLNDELEEEEYELFIVEFNRPDREVYFQEIYENIVFQFKDNSLSNYGFLITIGSVSYALGSYHFVETYSDVEFMAKIIWQLKLKRANILVVTLNYDEHIPFIKEDDVIRCASISEYKQVLDSRAFRYDVIIDGASIPRYSLDLNKDIDIEYGKYYAELKEKYIPYPKKNTNLSEAQSIIKIFSGFNLPEKEIKYLFEKTMLKGILFNEYDKDGNSQNHAKFYTKTGNVKIINKAVMNTFMKELLENVLDLYTGGVYEV